jgi:four helix bundle protein
VTAKGDHRAHDAYDRSLSLLRSLVPVLERLTARDPKLADQLRRAAPSVSLNIAEANQRTGRDRRNRFRIALGSAAEVASCLDVAIALRYVGEADHAEAYALVDRVRAMTYRLANR